MKDRGESCYITEGKGVPEISRFFGIIIRMYFGDHDPPHFHAFYGEYVAVIGIESIEVIAGKLPHRAVSMAIEWAALHQRELMENLRRLHEDESARKIPPLR